ncbi:MAG: InlB B-repeat-containing protein, partial [Lachnospira sp.]|nr:InlB B-repeat-containing protein [Lachnospira sp.]
MRRIKKLLICLVLLLGMTMIFQTQAYADSIGDTGGTGQGNITGTNVYTFYYVYDSANDAIELKVTTLRAIASFGNTTSHTFTSPSDQTVLNTSNPKLGSSLESAIATMNSAGGYNLSATDAKAALNALGYYDSGNGIWKWSGGYLTYVSAVKIRPQKHTVHYDANGGSGAPGNQTKTQGEAMYISGTKPTRSGYTFGGWNASIGGTYQPGDNYTHDQDGGTVTMKAKWNPWKHTIKYDANGGTGAPSNQTKTYGQSLNLSTKKPTRSGYTFGGWTCSLGGTYQPGDNYSHDQNGGTVTMKAKWNPWKHTIKYNANGGTGAPGNQTKTYGQALTLSSKKPTRTGYTFKGWTCSIGGTFQPGATYTHDQNGGTVTMTAKWRDETPPSCSDFIARPNQWSAGNGTVTFTAQDQGSGITSIVLERYSYVTRAWSTVNTWSYGGTTSVINGSYTETSEGVFYYKLTITDKAGNVTTKTSASIYLDHSNPVLSGAENTVTDWTNIAPIIKFSATDYLSGTTYIGSNLASVKINDDSGTVVASGISSAMYTLAAKYEGIHTWYITATDNVGHTSSASVTTKYDITKPGVDGTEITFVKPDGITVSGYCQDNIIDQHLDDEAVRSVNHPNATSGLKSILLYKVRRGVKTSIVAATTKATFGASNTHSSFEMYYDINSTN